MKKWLYIICFCFLFLPCNIFAYEGITNYYMDVTVKNNGDLEVKELAILNGSFNGFERIIEYKNNKAMKFDGSLSSFEGSSIYNGDGIVLHEVKTINVKNPTFSSLFQAGTVFEKVNTASKGDKFVYTKQNYNAGTKIRMYHPNGRDNIGFYLSYTLKNMGIVHEDIAEYGWNIFSDKMNEYINHLEVKIHLPNNKEILRVWGHGPLVGETKILDQNTLMVTVDELYANNPIDVRFVFDKEVLNHSSKYSHVSAMDLILQVEQKAADLANKEREEAKALLEKQKRIGYFCNIGLCIGLILLVIIIFYIYIRYDKEYKSKFNHKYVRDIPSNDRPSVIGYLLNKNITNNDLSACILNLMQKKIIQYETIPDKKKNYKLMLVNEDVDPVDQALITFLFNGKKEVYLSDLKKYAKRHYEDFLNDYTYWKSLANKEAKAYQFYEEKWGARSLGILYAIILLIVSVFLLILSYGNVVIPILSLLTSFLAIVYFCSFKKRSIVGNEEYHKWMGLKNFMKDFGRMDEKELPEMVLWERYLVYAVTLGCAEQLAKTMEIRAHEMLESESVVMFDISDFYIFLTFNRMMDQTIHNAMSTAYSAQAIANSSTSSGSGFGGGFSKGGGSFGGGGGGGRF